MEYNIIYIQDYYIQSSSEKTVISPFLLLFLLLL